ncbi:Choline kinase alpha [Liparis tanakae]|uniref:ethanolamine kinase n=1 Tax=Liparis tanakae TaxID=230148 RepID=A0A4Z2FWF5_9TELE|nr:Choline kinase alpha [Liparis tanakae]
MRLSPSRYVSLFRLSRISRQLRWPVGPLCRFRTTSHAGPPSLPLRELTMQSSRSVASGRGGRAEEPGLSDQPGPGLSDGPPEHGAPPAAEEPGPGLSDQPGPGLSDGPPEHGAPPAAKARVGSSLLVLERTLRTPSPLFAANFDDDSEAEAFKDGRTEGVDRDTRGRAFTWCRDFLSGSWKTIEERDFQISIVSGGLSNLLYLCSLPDHVPSVGEEPHQVLLRVYGAILQNTRMRTDQLSNPAISAEIASKLAHFHEMSMPFNKEPKWLLGTIKKYLDQVMLLNFVREAHVKKYNKLMKLNLPAELESLWGFDFGNHFCEWMYDYTYNQWPFYKARPEKYPSREQQLNFIRGYLAEQRRNCETIVDQTQMEEDMITEANRYALASHFLWGLWSVIQAKISKIEFGYMDYAICRFDAYSKQKKLFSGSPPR